MSMDWNDPRLTAYALGELEGDELKEMEALVRENKEAREYVREVRNTANALSSELKSEPIPQTVTTAAAKPWWKIQVLNPYFSMAVAGLAAVFLVWPQVSQRLAKPTEEPELVVNAPPRPEAEAADAVMVALPEKSEAKARTQPATVVSAAPTSTTGFGTKGEAGLSGGSASHFAMRKKVSSGFAPEGEMDGSNTESYSHLAESDFFQVGDQPLSTFSIDVDTASYAVIRRYLNSGALPPVDAVRIEEMINYFPYSYAPPNDGKPFSVSVEQMQTPWKKEHKLVRIGLKSKDIDLNRRPKSNLVFLLDVSGSMNDANKLPLLKSSLRQMIQKFNDNDRVAIVVYAGASGLVLPSTSNQNEILKAIEKLESGGSTNGGEGIELAYKVAQENFIEGGSNRVILATDGDFNVGTTSEGDLVRMIEKKAQSKIFLTVLGFGSGNYKDSTMEKLANKGNGNYAYIDTLAEAKKALVEQMGGTLVTVAKDVKIQVEFNPKFVSAYRLIGYENRKLNKEDFNDDAKDAGEIGAGHTITALYELVPAGMEVPAPTVDRLKYAKPENTEPTTGGDGSQELLTVKLRYKQPEGEKSQLIEVPVNNEPRLTDGSADFKFAAAVAQFGMLLRDSKWKGQSSFNDVRRLGRQGLKPGSGSNHYREEFLDLVSKAEKLKAKDR
jgi:Ca-activated chloride channel homolog